MPTISAVASAMVITHNQLGDADRFAPPSATSKSALPHASAYARYRDAVGDRIASAGIAQVSEGALAGRFPAAAADAIVFEPSPCRR